MSTGWQQSPVEPRLEKKCPHLGLLGATFTLHLHPPGHEWVCTCGARFVVVTDGVRRKFEKRRRR